MLQIFLQKIVLYQYHFVYLHSINPKYSNYETQKNHIRKPIGELPSVG